MKDTDDVSKLIRLKRYETPGEEYFSNFADDFKDRQRAEMFQTSSLSIFRERALAWYEQSSSNAWLVPTGAAAAAAVAISFVVLNSSNEPADLPVSGIAEFQGDADISLPAFPDSPEEDIELNLPEAETSPPPATFESSPGILPAGAGPLIEL